MNSGRDWARARASETACGREIHASGIGASLLDALGGAAACALLAVAAVAAGSRPVEALPSFARQTGQPCATCHNGYFFQLTPFGRQFKLNGYTAGGTRCRRSGLEKADSKPQIPLAVMVISTYQHSQKDLPELPTNRNGVPNGLKTNNNVMPAQNSSIFYGGQVYCELGAFVQATYSRADEVFALDNAEFRYANRANVGGVDLIYGFTANNNPLMEDPWNTTPTWLLPRDPTSAFAPDYPAPLIDGGLAQQVGGGGAYVFANNMFYAAVSAYETLDKNVLQSLGLVPQIGIDGVAPVWRVAMEKTWDTYSLMLGTFGMKARIQPNPAISSPTDRYTDVGWDAQFQYVGDTHFLTARLSYIYEWQTLNATFGAGDADNLKNHLAQFNASLTYSYDATYSVTLAYFNTRGSTDAALYADSRVGSPNTSGEIIDIGFAPWSRGGPCFWPWLNTRLGVKYTHYDKINGASTDYDGNGRNAKDENTVLLYAWTAF